MKKEYLFLLTGMLLAGIIFSFIQLSVAAPAATNPGHPADSIGGTAISDRTFQDATYAFPDALSVGTTTEPTEELNVDGNIQATEFMGMPLTVVSVEYCITGTSYNGNLGGRSGANAKCESECGSGFRFATIHDPPVPRASTSTGGWWIENNTIMLYTGSCPFPYSGSYYWVDGSDEDCNDWTSLTAGYEGLWNDHGCPPNDGLAWMPCNNSRKLLCVRITEQ